MDRVIGINGESHFLADKVGNDTMTLGLDHLPPIHIKYQSICDIREIGQSTMQYDQTYGDHYNTSSSGNGLSFALYQPTIFVGNLFIYAGHG